VRCGERAGNLYRLVEPTVPNCVAFPPLTISENVWHSCSGALEMIAPETIHLNGTGIPGYCRSSCRRKHCRKAGEEQRDEKPCCWFELTVSIFHKMISFSVSAFGNFSS
jgi:hypothetical protein